MLDPKIFDEITQKFSENLPDSLQLLKNDIEQNFKSALQAAFSKMDLVTREEFDVQSEVLAKTREQLETLQQRVETLEQQNK